MIEITEKEYAQFQALKKMFTSTFPEQFPDAIFICGESRAEDTSGFPERIHVCRAYGSDLVRIYSLEPIK